MQLIDGVPICSATDLVGFLACRHLTNLERAAAAGLVERPMRADPELDRIATRGLQHEQRFLSTLRAEGLGIAEILPDDSIADRGARLHDQAARTLAAMRAGVDVIYQATFFESETRADRVSPADGAPAPGLHWLGFADFLRRVGVPSDLGAWSYEVWDTKLARHTKASAVLQLCLYTDLVARLQGLLPAEMHVALGGSAHAVDHLRTADYMAYFRLVRGRFEALLEEGPASYPPATRPDPVEHCEVCRWSLVCDAWWRAHDDLSLVAGITARQRRALREHEPPVDTRRKLATVTLPLDPPLPRRSGVREEGLHTVREQARIQVRGEEEGRVLYELLAPDRLPDGSFEPDRGLLSLPAPSPGDLFLDLEGDPFAMEDGVDYLFGLIEPAAGEPAAREPAARDSAGGAAGDPAFHAIWSLDPDGQVTPGAEKAAFERLVDLIVDRRARDPNLHVYHYAAYEPTAMGRLSERYATRENEVDALLRAGVFVDLFRAVRQGLRASVRSYSIKKLEPLYAFVRQQGLRDAGSSIVEFETWLELGDDEVARGPEILATIERYNRDDCLSNWRLRDWLEERREELGAQLGLGTDDLPRPVPASDEPTEKLSDYLRRAHELEARLTADIPPAELADPSTMPPERHARWLLAQLLEWHRREDKSVWWDFFRMMRLTDEQLIEDTAAIGGLTPVGDPWPEKKSVVQRYRFPEQEHDIEPGTDVFDPETQERPGDVVAVNDLEGWLDLKRGPKRANTPHPRSLVPRQVVDAPEQRESLLRMAAWVAANGIDAAGPYRAARDLLLRRPPRLAVPADDGRQSRFGGDAPPAGRAAARRGDAAGPEQQPLPWDETASMGHEPLAEPDATAPLLFPGEHGAPALRRLAPRLDHSFLAVQGPPGSGKTTAGGELIVDLVESGHRVGVTANSHKVIGNLLDAVARSAKRRDVKVDIGQKPANDDEPTCQAARCLTSNDDLRDALAARQVQVAGATAWAWSRADMSGSVDVLVVDEAGQLSLANVVAVAPAAHNLVLLGDPQQLDQPLKGRHPPGADRSALGHLLGEAKTMPDHLGLLLESTWRLHPAICAYTSEVFYDGRLEPGEGTQRQALAGPGLLAGTGIRWMPVDHVARVNDSPEEADLVARLLGELAAAGGSWVTVDGEEKRLDLGDAIVITPYNAQVRQIAARVPARARVGTVDKFQGQEAPISIYSMATSSADLAPRGMEFLYSLNRLNVASSRARCLAIVVASPGLIQVQCRTPRQMRLANALARLAEVGETKARIP